jgi:hypothetical protein
MKESCGHWNHTEKWRLVPLPFPSCFLETFSAYSLPVGFPLWQQQVHRLVAENDSPDLSLQPNLLHCLRRADPYCKILEDINFLEE